MRIANLYIVHRNPAQVKRLIEAMAHPEIDHFIHLDYKCDLSDYQHLAEIERVVFLKNRINVLWGGRGIMMATLGGLNEILETKPGVYDYLNVMSGQDYPVRPVKEFHDFIAANAGSEFVDFREHDQHWDADVLYRVQRYSMINWKVPGKYRIEQLVNKLFPIRKFPFPTLTFGSNWFTITEACARYAVAQSKENKAFMRFLQHVWSADEFYFQNVIFNSPFKNRIGLGNLRYLDWSDHKANPKTFSLSDLEAIKASGKHLARKFDTDQDARVMDALDEYRNQQSN